MIPGSLRVRLLVLAALSILTTLAIAGVSLVLIFERHLERRVEHELEVRWLELATAFSLDDEGQPELIRDLSDPRYRQPHGGSYWQVTADHGAVLRSRSLWDSDIPANATYPTANRSAYRQRGPGGSSIYVIERPITLGPEGTLTRYRLAVALDYTDVQQLRDLFGKDVALSLAVLAFVLFSGAWLQTSVGLRPLTTLRRELTRLRQGHAVRLEGPFPEEVEPLADDLNRVLERQNQLIIKARDRAGDLAHGLKTPLTILFGEARRIESTGLRDSARLLRDQIKLMRDHVERELARTRTQGAAAAVGTQTDVTETVHRLISLMRRMPRGEALVWQVELPAVLQVDMDPHDFGEIVGNLLDNARKWARTRVAIRLERKNNGQLELLVIDDGPGIPAHMHKTVKRGERGSADGEGFGLGLSIVGDVLEVYGARLQIADVDGGGSCVSFKLRALPEPAATEAWRNRWSWLSAPFNGPTRSPTGPGVEGTRLDY